MKLMQYLTSALPCVAGARFFSLAPSSRKGCRQRGWRRPGRGALPRLRMVGLAVLLCVPGGPGAAPAAAQQTLVSLYWPMNDGDVLNYSGIGGTASLQTQEDDSSFELPGFWIDISGSEVASESLFCAYSGAMDQLFNYAQEGFGVEVDFNPPWLLLDEGLLQRGGATTTRFTASVPDVTNLTVSASVTVTSVGQVTVPAGTYANCRQVTLAARVAGMALSGNALILAPGVGPIKVGVMNAGLHVVGWQSLTDGTVGGVDVSSLGVVSSVVHVQVSGPGTVTPDYDGQALLVGGSFSMTAKARSGSLFSNWTDGDGNVLASTPTLKFIMQSNLILVANFLPNPFIPEQGTFTGLFLHTNEVTEASSGFFTLTLTKSGAFTGKIMTSGGTYSLPTTTPFDAGGQVQFMVPTKQHTLTFNLQLDLGDPANQQITGTVSDGAWTAGLTAERAVFSATTNKAVSYDGRFTLAISGSEDAAASAGGFGWATLSVSPAGLITMAGSLADGTAVSQSVSVSKDGRWPFYAAYSAPPSGSGGAVFGWLTFSNQPASSLGGTLYWFRPAGKTPTVYQSGFTNLGVSVIGSAYNPAAKPSLALTSGQVTLDGGNLPSAITNQITLSPSGAITVTPPNTDKLVLTINKTTGAITGTFAKPSNPKQTVKINGVLLQNQTNAAGYFLGTSQSGAFLLEKP